MFKGFTDEARMLLIRAAQEASALNHAYVGTEHLLLGLTGDDSCTGTRVLHALGLRPSAIRDAVQAMMEHGTTPTGDGHVPYTPRAKRVLELSLREALQLDDEQVGSQHVLLALLCEADGIAGQVLINHGADLATARAIVQRIEPSTMVGGAGWMASMQRRRWPG